MDAVSSAKMQCLMSGGQQRELGRDLGGPVNTYWCGICDQTKSRIYITRHQVTACTKTIMYGVYTEIF